jgi:hypothetical protein
MSQQDNPQSQPWRFIKMDQFHLPPEPTREKVRRGFLGIWDRLTRRRSAAESPAVEIDLVAMPSNLLAEVAPAPDWLIGAAPLQEALQDWWHERSGKNMILVGAPYSSTADIVIQWAQAFECPVLPEPPLDQIKSGGNKWLEQIDQIPDRVWVIPRLERFFSAPQSGFCYAQGSA